MQEVRGKDELIESLRGQIQQLRRRSAQTTSNPFETHKQRIQDKILAAEKERKEFVERKASAKGDCVRRVEEAAREAELLRRSLGDANQSLQRATLENESLKREGQDKLKQLKEVDFQVGQQLHRRKQRMDLINRGRSKLVQSKEELEQASQTHHHLRGELSSSKALLIQGADRIAVLAAKRQDLEAVLRREDGRLCELENVYQQVQEELKGLERMSDNSQLRIKKLKKEVGDLKNILKSNEGQVVIIEKHVESQKEKWGPNQKPGQIDCTGQGRVLEQPPRQCHCRELQRVLRPGRVSRDG